MSSHRRAGGPRGLAAVLSKVTRPLFRARGFGASGLLTDWPDIVGRPLADFTLPERLGRDGVLAVRVADGPLPSRPASRRRSPRALDAGEEAALSARLSDAGDPGLRAALERLGRAVFGSTPAAGGGAPGDTRHDTPRSDGA
jgi:hypothetical protein